jgi:c-di-GMP-related signal transduction protein
MIGKLSPKEINSLYRAVQYLKINALRKCLACVMACRVFIEPTLENYNKKKSEIGLKEELTTEKSKEYKDRFPFMN